MSYLQLKLHTEFETETEKAMIYPKTAINYNVNHNKITMHSARVPLLFENGSDITNLSRIFSMIMKSAITKI